MLVACERIDRNKGDLTKEQFLADEKSYDAAIRCLTIIGEAAKGIPADMRERYPNIAWRSVAGLRDRVVHHYFGVDPDIVWDVIINHLPGLRVQLQIIANKRNLLSE